MSVDCPQVEKELSRLLTQVAVSTERFAGQRISADECRERLNTVLQAQPVRKENPFSSWSAFGREAALVNRELDKARPRGEKPRFVQVDKTAKFVARPGAPGPKPVSTEARLAGIEREISSLWKMPERRTEVESARLKYLIGQRRRLQGVSL